MVTITGINAIIALNKGWGIYTLAFSIAILIISVVNYLSTEPGGWASW